MLVELHLYHGLLNFHVNGVDVDKMSLQHDHANSFNYTPCLRFLPMVYHILKNHQYWLQCHQQIYAVTFLI